MSELKYVELHQSRFYDEAVSAFELTTKAKALYDEHRQEHTIGVGLENSKRLRILEGAPL